MNKRLKIKHMNLVFWWLKPLLLLITILIKTTLCYSQNAQQTFEKANVYYQKNDLENAIKAYEKLLKENYDASAIYYNLGNAYYKLNNNTAAILNYEKAKKRTPHDEDVLFNLQIANLKVTDKVEAVPVLFYENWWNSLLQFFTFDHWARIGVFLIWLVFAMVLLFIMAASRLLKQLSFYASIALFVSALLVFYMAHDQYDAFENSNEAVVSAPSVYIKSSPTDKSTDLFILHEGAKVQVMDKVGPWKKIRLLNGNIGWLKENTVVQI